MDFRAKAISSLLADIEGETKQALRRAVVDGMLAYRKLNRLWD